MNAKRREYMVGVLPKRRILMRHGESKGDRDTTMYTITPDHNIQSMTQGMAQALRTGEHLRRVIVSDDYSPDWRVQFYVSPYTRTRSMLCELK